MVNNAVPNRVARVLSADLLEITMTLGPPGDPDVFVTAADDVAEISAAAEMARRLTLVDEAGNLIRGRLLYSNSMHLQRRSLRLSADRVLDSQVGVEQQAGRESLSSSIIASPNSITYVHG